MGTLSRKTAHQLFLGLTAVALINGAWRAPADAQPARSGATHVASPDGIRIAYEVHGEGTPALVFVHGWSCDRTYWAAQIP